MTRPSRPILATLTTALLVLASDAARAEPTLLADTPFEATLAAGEDHTVTTTLTAHDPWLVTVDQLDLDVTVAVTSPAGDSYGPVDLPFDRRGSERLLLYPTHGGRHTIEVRARETRAPRGGYRLRVDRLPAATWADQRRLAAEADETAAAVAYAGGEDEDWARAAERLRRAAAAWRELGERRRLAFAVHGRAVLLRLLDRGDEATAAATEAAALFAELGGTGFAGAAANELGLLRWTGGDLDAAAASFARARDLQGAAGDPLGEALARSNLCLVELARNRLRSGRDCYRELLPLLARVQATQLDGAVYSNLGRVAEILGDPDEALAFQRQAVAVLRAGGEARTEARALRNLGVSLRKGGDVEGAIAAYSRALELTRDLGDGRWQGRVTVDLGAAYAVLGERERAAATLAEALALGVAHGDIETEAGALRRLAELDRDAGDLAAAARRTAREVALWRERGDRRQEAAALLVAAETDLERGRADAALDTARTVAALADTLGDRPRWARATLLAGRALLATGDPAAATRELAAAVTAARELADPRLEATALGAAARALAATGDLSSARERATAALDLTAARRDRLLAPELHTAFAAEHHAAAALWLDLAAAAPALPAAERLAVADRAQARTLVELLAARPGAAGLAESDAPLLDRLAAAERRLAAKEERLAALAADDPEHATVAAERRDVLRRRDLLSAELSRRRPALTVLHDAPLDLAAVRRRLGDGTQALVYFLGEEGGHLWLLDGDGVTAFALPARGVIAPAVRELHAVAGSPTPDAAALRRAATLRAELAATLLGPVAGRLAGRRLVIVPDGAVAYVPFAALPLPGGDLVVDRFELAFLPSLSTLAGLPGGHEAAPSMLALYADPVVSRRDPRLAAATSAATVRERSAPGGSDLARLPGTAREAAAVGALAPGRSLRRLGFAARRDAVLGDPLRYFRVVHFATHGVVDPDRPTRTGLVLSRFTAEGAPLDGLLRLRDVHDLELAAELVTLSGCRTSLGREAAGEGVFGLARAFLVAGARAVVATQTPLDDRAATVLMESFYRALWRDGLAPAAALRRGQLAVRDERRWRDPRYWSGVQLVGDGGRGATPEVR